MTRIIVSLLAVSAALASPLSTAHNDFSYRSSLSLAPLVDEFHPHGTVNNSYIVIFKNDVPFDLISNHMSFLHDAHAEDPLVDDFAGVQQVYDGHLNGYAGRFTRNVVDRLRAMPEVAYIEKDQIVHTTEHLTQKGAPWGLARVSHRPELTFSTFTKYVYDSQAGQGVDAYVIDTGINVQHEEFEGRATWGKTVPQDEDEDGNGHGTHCAGTIASRKYGIAKHANVIAVKVLGSNGSGTMSDVVSGVVWAAREAKAKAVAAAKEFAATGKTKHKGSVANMSLGGGKSPALDDAVNGAVDTGLHFAVAAGNENRDACSSSPASAEKAITVGASTLGDARAYFSNYGPCVDVFGPGLNIKSTYKGGRSATAILSGTSMASPHTAGVLAYLLSIYPSKEFNPIFEKDELVSITSPVSQTSLSGIYAITHAALPQWISSFLPAPEFVDFIAPIPGHPPTLTPTQLKKALIALSTPDMLDDLPANTVNLLIFNNATHS
ncbi:hypothetical protein Agabi119p4_2160 [Agaricus bisporus var. burnettii]|uniref:Peptidase S8/S53 domain-containing protein n=1 Tax=Agaricus bisporus var. burnettii TaxID=192524 RepID=A0A8H7F8X7_AGABI|nr:hypothetical protein Agabi119p4_2160 [Agaricus bisporus var. burnettii]